MSWVISNENRPSLILEINENLSESIKSSIMIHPKLRILIKEKIGTSTKSSNLLYNDVLRPLPWLRLKLEELGRM